MKNNPRLSNSGDMAKKRKDESHLEISNIKADLSITVERDEILKLTKLAKSWEFTCSFCFKRFASAQAMGGHQNAHHAERLEEKRLFVRDPIGYRKRAYLRAMKAMKSEISGGLSSSSPNLHAASKIMKNGLLANIYGPPEILKKPNWLPSDSGEFNASSHKNNNFCLPSICKDSPINGENLKKLPLVLINFLPPKELSLAESVGGHAEDAKGKACAELDFDGYEIKLQKLDLTLKL